MRITGISVLHEGQRKYPESRNQLAAWLKEATDAEWDTPQKVKDRYPPASFLADNRVIFNIKGNKFRLITRMNYQRQALHIIWFGTHKDYDRIDSNRIGR